MTKPAPRPTLDLSALVTSDNSSMVLGSVTFSNLTATVYYMVDQEDGRVNSGVSFLFDGGKFSAPIDPVIGKQLADACDRERITFSKVTLEITPAAFGREKRVGLKPVRVLALYCGDKAVYHVSETI